MHIQCISDTHRMHSQVTIPECDLLLYAGDWSGRKTWELKGQEKMTNDFLDWLIVQPAKDIVFISGNHDFHSERHPTAFKKLLDERLPSHVHYLEAGSYLHSSTIIVQGKRIFGNPYTPWFHDWSFNFPEFDPHAGYEVTRQLWDRMPMDTDIVLTHGPPLNIRDRVGYDAGPNVGCPIMAKKVQEVEPDLVVFGHIHESRGVTMRDEIIYVNAASQNFRSGLMEESIGVTL